MANEKRLIDANAPIIKEYFNPRLIDYREFVKECNHFYENPPFPHPATPWHKGLQLAVEIAMRLKPVDAVEVKHGRWIDGSAIRNGKEVYKSIDCSVCEEYFKVESHDREYWKARFKVCPFCGAKMDGDGNV